MDARLACKFIVGLLHLAATENCEHELGEAVMQCIARSQSLQLANFQNQFKKNIVPPIIAIAQHELKSYDLLTVIHQEVMHG